MFTYSLKTYLRDVAEVREQDAAKPRLVKSSGKRETNTPKIIIRRRAACHL